MTLDPFLQADPIIRLHAASALAAIPLGAVVLWRTKGTALHRALGRVWVFLIVLAAVTSLFIHEMRMLGPLGPIHLLTLVVAWHLAKGLWAIAVRRDVVMHRKAMEDLYVWSLLIAGAFTFWPGRRTHQAVFGPDASGASFYAALLLACAAILAWYWRRHPGPTPVGPARPQKRQRKYTVSNLPLTVCGPPFPPRFRLKCSRFGPTSQTRNKTGTNL